ncbi:MAG: hypothetical protein WAX89_04085 [Alphaproteobacteria bacterium]
MHLIPTEGDTPLAHALRDHLFTAYQLRSLNIIETAEKFVVTLPHGSLIPTFFPASFAGKTIDTQTSSAHGDRHAA